MKILIACEESQIVTAAFRSLQIEAFSCDILPCSGGHPKWHIKDDVLNVINDKWTAMIAFPPCTHLAVSGAAWFKQKKEDGRQQQGVDFFMSIINAPIKYIAVENPIGIMSRLYRKPDQIIHPYYFGDKASKATCLWLKNLPRLYHNSAPNLFDDHVTHTDKGQFWEYFSKAKNKISREPIWKKETIGLNPDERSKMRSKTYPGIANAMANQWGNYLLNYKTTK